MTDKEWFATSDGQKAMMRGQSRAEYEATRKTIDLNRVGDYGADPIGDGTFRMVPSGDIVDYSERCKRLNR
jgi:hypothetical protein